MGRVLKVMPRSENNPLIFIDPKDADVDYIYAPAPPISPREGICEALNRYGQPCWNRARRGQTFCHVHDGSAKKEPDEMKQALKKWKNFFDA